MSTSAEEKKNDWSATQYLKFYNERTRPVHDLVAQVSPLLKNSNPRIYDLGCGPGNSTKVLADELGHGASITGVDSSPDMLRKARESFKEAEGEVRFEMADLENWMPEKGADLLFSNAVFHWVRSSKRIDTVVGLLKTLGGGGVLAFQVPDNYHEPSHAAMRDVALQTGKPWSPFFADAHVGDLSNPSRPDLDPIESPAEWYKALIQHCEEVQIWRTQYQHVLKDHGAIVEWVKGTGLQPFLNSIADEQAKAGFLGEYERVLSERYENVDIGGGEERVILQYPRLFVVGVRK